MTREEILYKIISRILKELNCYEAYKKNLANLRHHTIKSYIKYVGEEYKQNPIGNFINCSFIWYKTPQGDIYWRTINGKFNAIVDNILFDAPLCYDIDKNLIEGLKHTVKSL